MTLKSGFTGERLRVLPAPILTEAASSGPTRRLLVTDCGYFPHAAQHLRSRPKGARQTIVIVCIEGSGWCRLEGELHPVSAGQALVIPAGVPHSYGSDETTPWSVWWLHVDGTDVADLVAATGATTSRPVLPVAHPARAVALIDEAISAMEKDESPSSLVMAAGATWHLLAMLAAGKHQVEQGRPDPVAMAIACLQQDLSVKMSVGELAATVGLSPSHLSALFRKATGCGPGEYQTRLRMSASRDLLDSTDLPVSTIGRHVGYADAYYFARQFRAAHGMTATQYRSRAKG
jgi:AraC family transcriptional regulator, arabinose operon regulatory protein